MSNQDTCKCKLDLHLQPKKPEADDKTAEWVKGGHRMRQGKIQIDESDSIASYETARNLINALNSINSRKEQIDFIADFLLRVCHICETHFKEDSKEAVIVEPFSKVRGFLAE